MPISDSKILLDVLARPAAYKPLPSKMPNALAKTESYKYRNIATNNDYVWDIMWMYTPQLITDTVDNYIHKFNGLITAVLAQSTEEKTFANTFVLFDDFVVRNHFDIHRILFLQHVSQDEVIRDASVEAEKKLNEFNINMGMRTDLYELAQKIYDEESKSLQGEDLLYLQDQLRTYKRNGLNLDEATRDKIKALTEELSNLCTDFSINIAKDNTTIQFTRQELDGLSDNYFSGLEPVGTKNMYTITMKYPHVFPILEKANNEETRRKMELVYNSRCKENIPILFKILKLRYQLAKILGYSTWADYVLELNMAKSELTVKRFLSNLVDKLMPLRDRELNDMQVRKGSPIQQHDWRYFSELEKIEKYNVDSDKVKEYFPLNSVLTHMFHYFEKLLGFRFMRGLKESWHADAWEWVVYDITENKIIGKFYLDIFPRDNKFTHAACFPLKYATHADPYSVCVMICNFTKATDDMPSLLTHSEVETLYHEFGHVMHNICARTYYANYSGTQTDRDFVEAPSQILENWCWEFSTIKELSKHYQTGEPMPDDMIKKIIATRYVSSGITNCRQLTLGIIDQLLHTEDVEKEDDIELLYNQICEKIMGMTNQEGTGKLAIFGHIAGGYDAAYYSYMWSKVYADDMYGRLKELLAKDPKAGLQYRYKILAWGGSRDPMVSLQDFLGRDPDPSAFIRNLGL